ncbi:MAG: discoidin domain-containing protein [Gemmatimonadaceae bacterium]
MSGRVALVTLATFATLVTLGARASAQTRTLDAFETLGGWTAAPSDGVTLSLAQDSGVKGKGLRLDFDFHGGGGYAIARKTIAVELPANYAFAFSIRGNGPVNNLELKLVDPTGDNVWWTNRRDFAFPRQWTTVTTKKRHVEFAWGPVGGGDMKRVAAIEIAITAGRGGKGSVWLDELTFTSLPPAAPYAGTPLTRASAAARGEGADRAIDGDSLSAWRSDRRGENAWLALDFRQPREYGGLVITWDPHDYATAYEVQTSDDGQAWHTAYTVDGGNGGRDFIYLPETESRQLRLHTTRSSRSRGYAVRDVAVQPLEWAPTPNRFFELVARAAPRGSYPKYLRDSVQSYWTIVGVNGDRSEAMINEEGMLEVDKGSFSIEPFLRLNDTLITWSDVTPTQSLEGGYLPIPSVRWETRGVALTVTAFADGAPGASQLYARYRVENRGPAPARGTLYLAVRPFQVNPTWQFLNTPGGAATVRSIAYAGGVVRVSGDSDKVVVPLEAPVAFGAATFDQGDITDFVRRGALPQRTSVTDPFAHASAALAYDVQLAPGGRRDVYVAIPFHGVTPPARGTDGGARLAAVTHDWEAQLDRVTIELPPAAERIARTIKTTLAYILINRDGPAIQPGSRSYERSWIRDGSLTSAALLRLGHAQEVREFLEWYAPYQYPFGKVPCCVDSRGADPVPEHDSHGQLIYLIAEYYRFTQDRALLERMWPHIAGAVSYIDSLRHTRMTPEYQAPDKRAFFGLMPQSISHEGYSAKPMHSYWDDFFTMKGLKDAAEMATVLGKVPERAKYVVIRDEFRRDLVASIRLAMASHKIDFIPGSVELGDFDATSTTVGIAPVGELRSLPQPALARTFDKYFENARARRDGTLAWEAYTPYEHRTVGTFVRLGQKDRAHEMLDFFFRDQRPAAWNHWAEVVWHDPKTPKFIGDMPHTWVGSDFIRSVTDMLAYEREEDSALVVGAGIREDWVTSESGVVVRDLPTYYGALSFTMKAEGADVRVRVSGDLRVPPGGIVISSPRAQGVRRAMVNGQPAQALSANGVVVTQLPADILLRY